MVVAMKSSQTPEKKPMRSVTEYIRSPAQLNQIKSEAGKQSRQQTAAKNFFRKNEAQMVADLFRARVEQELEEEVEDWRVTDFQGDLTRKAILKVQVGQDEFVHLYATRPSRNDQWICLYAPFKTPRCTLEMTEDYYYDLPDRRMCSERFDVSSCSTREMCQLM